MPNTNDAIRDSTGL